MKKIISIIVPLVFLTNLSCDKEDIAPKKEFLLNNEYYKGNLTTEYIYGLDRKLNKINYFSNSLGQPSKSGYVIFNYDSDGLLQESVRFDEDNVVSLRFLYFYNASGQVTRRETYSVGFNDEDIVNMDNYALYDYNTEGHMIKETYRLPDNSLAWYHQYTYDQNDNIQSKSDFKWDEEESDYTLYDSTAYEHEDKPLPSYLKDYLFHPLEFDFHRLNLLREYSITYLNNGNIYTIERSISDQVYNDEGYLIEQLFSSKTAINDTESTSMYNYTYDYIEIN